MRPELLRVSLRRHAVLFSLVALTALLEAAIWLRSPVVAPDGIHFIAIAQDLGRDPLAAIRAYDQHPGYPALVCAVRETVFAWSTSELAWLGAARFVSAVCGVAGVIVVWLLARQIASGAVANLSALLYAILPVLRQNSADALSDTPHLLLYLTSVLLVVVAIRRHSPAWFCAAGVVSGLAFLVRPEGLSVALVAALLAIVWPSWRRELGWRRTLAASAVLAVGAALLVVPYVVASGRLSGKITAKIGWIVPAAAPVAPTAPPPKPPRAARAPRATGAPRAPRAAAPPAAPQLSPIVYVGPIARMAWQRALAEAVAVFAERMGESLRYILLVPLAFGVVAATQFGDRPTRSLLWALALFHIGLLLALYCASGYIDRRHTLPLVALLLPTIAAGLVALHAAAARLAVVRRAPRLAAGCGLLLLVLLLAPRALRPLHTTHQHTPAAAQLLDKLASPGDTILSNSRHVIYYASLRGKLAGGARLCNGAADDGPTQPGGHRFVVLEQGGEQFRAAWPDEIAADFVPVATIAGDAALDQCDIVIFERRTTIASAVEPSDLR